MATFLQIQTRFLALVDESAITSTHKSHINYSVQDITNAFPFSWNVKSGTVTLATNVGDLPTDYNPMWGIMDARVVNSGNADDVIFNQIPVTSRDSYGSSDPVYWITYDTTTSKYIFNSTYEDATVTVYYYFIPTDMSADGDVCIVNDAETVALLAASKHFLGEDQDDKLVEMYEKKALQRIQKMYSQNLNFSEIDIENSITSSQTDITVRGV
jgi:hypothetical protein